MSFLEVSGEDMTALSKFLIFMGSKTVKDLGCIEKHDFDEYQKPMSRTLKRKLLCIADFVLKGGNLKEIGSITRVIQSLRTSNDAAGTTTANASESSVIEDIIHLDVGGYKFTTTKATLCRVPGSVLEAMFSGRHGNPARLEKDGTYIIDRNGTHFNYILDYLRVGTVVSLPRDADAKEQLAIEADYFGLEDIVRAIRMPRVDVSEHLPEQVLSMRQEEDAIRQAFIDGSAGGYDLHRGLIPIFDPDNGVRPLPVRYEPKEDRSDLLMGSLRTDKPPGTPVTVKSLEEFRSNFNKEHPNFLNRITHILLEEPVIISGGSVLRALTATPSQNIVFEEEIGVDGGAVLRAFATAQGVRTADWWGDKSDVDLFIYANSPEEANRIARRIFYALAVGDERWAIVRSRGVITMHNWSGGRWDASIDLKVQIVLRLYDSPAEVLLGFDVDCCCCAYDGKSVWVTPRCLRALRTGANILNPLHSWPNKPSYELRLAKYAFRGFPVVVPGLDKKRIDVDDIRNRSLRDLKGMARLVKIAFEMEAPPNEQVSWWGPERGALKTEAFPRPPLRIKSLYTVARNDLSAADFTTRGMGSGYDEGYERSLIVPEVFGRSMAEWGTRGDFMWWFGDADDFPLARDCAVSAWLGIVDATATAPEGVPALLVDAWDTEKRSREYLNASLEAFELDNVYYGHAYDKKDVE